MRMWCSNCGRCINAQPLNDTLTCQFCKTRFVLNQFPRPAKPVPQEPSPQMEPIEDTVEDIVVEVVDAGEPLSGYGSSAVFEDVVEDTEPIVKAEPKKRSHRKKKSESE